MNNPSELKYTADHEWVRMEGEEAVIGITDFAQSQLGDIVFVDVTSVGESLSAGEVFGTVEAVKTVSDLFLPVAGEVVAFNEALDSDPSLVNRSPYGEGWMVRVRLTEPLPAELLTAEAYADLIR